MTTNEGDKLVDNVRNVSNVVTPLSQLGQGHSEYPTFGRHLKQVLLCYQIVTLQNCHVTKLLCYQIQIIGCKGSLT